MSYCCYTFICFLHIEDFVRALALTNDVYALYVICGLFVIGDVVLTFLLALNFFNYVFVNIGIGLTLTCVVLRSEFLFVIMKQRGKTISSVFMPYGMIYRVLKNKKYLHDVIYIITYLFKWMLWSIFVIFLICGY